MSRFLEMMPLTKFVAVLYAANSPYNTSAQDQLIYLHADHLGVVRRASDSDFSLSFSQRQVWSWESDPLGTTAPLQDPDGNGVPTVINLRFPGQYYDAESGLHYNGQRYYDPKMGRYISSDPIGLSGGMNTYAYVGNNPVNRFDIWGLVTVSYPVPPVTPRNYNEQNSPEMAAGLPWALPVDNRSFTQQQADQEALLDNMSGVIGILGGMGSVLTTPVRRYINRNINRTVNRNINPQINRNINTPSLPPFQIPSTVRQRIPSNWEVRPNRDNRGFRWQDPNNQGNGVRIDQGNPNNSQVIQQHDHVVVRSGGVVIGRDGRPINGSIRDDYSNSHIPLSEHVNWRAWNEP